MPSGHAPFPSCIRPPALRRGGHRRSGDDDSTPAKTRIPADVFAPSTQPAGPLEHLTATDQPLSKAGATGQTAEWLAAIRCAGAAVQLLHSACGGERGDTRYRIQYPSPFRAPSLQNNTVPAEYYVPRANAGTKEPAAIVLDILDGRAIIARSFARGHWRHMASRRFMFPWRYFGAVVRRASSADPVFQRAIHARSVDALRQTVMDVRRAKAILATRARGGCPSHRHYRRQPGRDHDGPGCWGRWAVRRVLPVLSGGDIASLVFFTRETRGLARQLEERGIDRDQLAKMLSPVEPLNFAARIDPSRCLMINGRDDEVIPRKTTDLLLHAIGSPQIFWVPTGHYGAILYLPQIQQTAANFLGGKAVDHFGF